MTVRRCALPIAIMATTLLLPEFGLCSVESSLMSLQMKLINVILPLVSVVGIVIAGFSFISGNPNGRNHLIMAGIGAAIGFGAPSIIAFIRGMVQ
jgi:hypothetical protein